MSENSNKPVVQSDRQEAHDVLEELLELEHQLATSKEGIGRGKIARDCQHVFHYLMSHFPELSEEYSKLFNAGKPFQDIENSAPPDVVNEWRKYVAAASEMGVPMSPRNRYRLAIALKALNKGELGRLLKPEVTSNRVLSDTLSNYQFLAIVHSHAIRGRGVKAKEAEGIVAKAYGGSGSQIIRSWVARRGKEDPYVHILDDWIKAAKTLGELGLSFQTNDEACSSFKHLEELNLSEFFELEAVFATLYEFHLELAGNYYQQALRKEFVPQPELFPLSPVRCT